MFAFFKSSHLSFIRVKPWILLLIGILVVYPAITQSAIVEVTYTFERPEVKLINVDGTMYHRVILLGAPNSGSIGHPALPAMGAKILLPYGTEVDKVEVIAEGRTKVGENYLVEPAETPIQLSSSSHEIPPLVPDHEVYSLDTPVPERRFDDINVQGFRGYRILILKLNPTEYIPTTGTLYYYATLRVKITTIQSSGVVSVLRNVPDDLHEVSSFIDNPSELSSYAVARRSGSTGYDLLIITPSSFVGAFEPLRDFHDTTGILTEIHTLEQIGSSNPHQIRDYIRDEFLTSGIQYVLIGADDELIPALDMYCISFDRPDAPVEYYLPGDFYFSCLDGTFNFDNDALWAEPGDGEGGGEIDLFPEVHVGRVSAESPEEVTNLVDKTITYLSTGEPYLEKILLSGEQLNFGGLGEYGGYAMDEMVDGSDSHGFSTYGFPSAIYQIDKLYDLTMLPSNYWPPSELITRINAGVHVVDHLGHSGPGYAMRTDTTMLRLQLVNTEYCFAYAEGCSAGMFDVHDCWAEYMTVKLQHGAFACVANARLGLGSRTTAHPVHLMNREFWDAIYDANEAKPQIGRAMSDARVDHVYRINDPGMRWTIYETTLFGDPAAAIRSLKSVAIMFPNDVPLQLHPDSLVSFEVVVNGIGEGIAVAGSGMLHYSIDGGELVQTAMTETSANNYLATLPSVTCGNEIRFCISVDEASGGTFFCPDTAEMYAARVVTDEVILFEDDFESDKGWLISGGLWERGTPLGLGGDELQYPVPDPTQGCLGPQVFGYNLAGDYENNLPETPITSPAIDCTGWDKIHLRYCRWLGVERPIYDNARVLASNDGTNWTEVWANDATIVDLEWISMDHDISAIADNQPLVYLRWSMGPTDGGLVYNGWNIDDVRLVSLACQSSNCTVDTDGDGYGDPGHPEQTCPVDNCPETPNPDQTDSDADGLGDLCDNCVHVTNPGQEDINNNSIGDACESCCGFWSQHRTGNTDCSEDGRRNLADITQLIDHVYVSKNPLCCLTNANVDGSSDGRVNLADITLLIDHVYVSKEETAFCEGNLVWPYSEATIQLLIWNTVGGGDILFDIERDEENYLFSISRYQFSPVSDSVLLTSADMGVYELVTSIFTKQRNLHNDTFEPQGPTGTWTTITLVFEGYSPIVIENIVAWEDLSILPEFVESYLDATR